MGCFIWIFFGWGKKIIVGGIFWRRVRFVIFFCFVFEKRKKKCFLFPVFLIFKKKKKILFFFFVSIQEKKNEVVSTE